MEYVHATVADVDAFIAEEIARPDTSIWLKEALRTALARDAVDALYDARMLVFALNERLEAVFRDAAVPKGWRSIEGDAPAHDRLPSDPCPYCCGYTADHSKCTCK
jgi:hypothetical protein